MQELLWKVLTISKFLTVSPGCWHLWGTLQFLGHFWSKSAVCIYLRNIGLIMNCAIYILSRKSEIVMHKFKVLVQSALEFVECNLPQSITYLEMSIFVSLHLFPFRKRSHFACSLIGWKVIGSVLLISKPPKCWQYHKPFQHIFMRLWALSAIEI